jgi:hypothetical protein
VFKYRHISFAKIHDLIYRCNRAYNAFIQFFLNLNPKKNHSNAVNAWKHPEAHPLTRSLGTILTTDAKICRMLAKIGIRLPGLSLATVIRKKAET